MHAADPRAQRSQCCGVDRRPLPAGRPRPQSDPRAGHRIGMRQRSPARGAAARATGHRDGRPCNDWGCPRTTGIIPGGRVLYRIGSSRSGASPTAPVPAPITASAENGRGPAERGRAFHLRGRRGARRSRGELEPWPPNPTPPPIGPSPWSTKSWIALDAYKYTAPSSRLAAGDCPRSARSRWRVPDGRCSARERVGRYSRRADFPSAVTVRQAQAHGRAVSGSGSGSGRGSGSGPIVWSAARLLQSDPHLPASFRGSREADGDDWATPTNAPAFLAALDDSAPKRHRPGGRGRPTASARPVTSKPLSRCCDGARVSQTAHQRCG